MNAPIHPLDVYTLPLAGTRLIEASAGTGKTWTMTGLVARLLLEQNRPLSSLLVVTFTEAATAELRERIRARLADLLLSYRSGHGVDEFCQRLMVALLVTPEEAMRRLQRAISGFDDASIFTIHGFCQRVLSEAVFESGGDYGFELVTADDDLLHEIAADFWRREVYAASPLWVAYLLENKASAANWLRDVRRLVDQPGLQLAVPSASQAQEARVEPLAEAVRAGWRQQGDTIGAQLMAAVQDKTLRNNIYKATSFAQRLADMAAFAAGRLSLFEVQEVLPWFTAAKLTGATANGKTPPSHALEAQIDALQQAIAALQEDFAAREAQARQRLLVYLNEELPRRKQRQKRWSFQDLLTGVYRALHGPSGERLASAVRQRYQAALIDEFQDTDPLQYAVFNRCFAGHGPLIYVGDPKQAIYSFRGADIYAYLEAARHTDSRETLTTNHRSVPALVAAVNQLFAGPQPFLDDGIAYHPVAASERPQPALQLPGAGAPFCFLSLEGEAPSLSAKEAAALATTATVAEIVRLLNAAAAGEAGFLAADGAWTALHPGDIAVLVGNHAEAGAMQQALLRAGVASVRRSRDSVFASDEAREMSYWLAALVQPNRLGFVRTALATVAMGWSAEEVRRIEQNGQWDAELDRFIGWREAWRRQGFMRAFLDWLAALGPDGLSVGQRLLRYADGERRLTNWLHLAELLQTAARGLAGPEALRQWFEHQRSDTSEQEAALLRLESDADRVQIATIHASKGLEYAVVFCPFLWKGPRENKDRIVRCHEAAATVADFGTAEQGRRREQAERERLAEQLRLLYVALTRAKHRCYVPWGAVDWPKPKKKDDQRVSGYPLAALSWLLHGCDDDIHSGEPLLNLRNRLLAATPAAAIEGLAALSQRCPEFFSVQPAASQVPAAQWAPAANRNTLHLAPYHRPAITTAWGVTSFTRLSHGAERPRHDEKPDHDALTEQPSAPVEEARTVFSFPRGEVPASEAGSCIHAILETWRWPDESALQTAVARELPRYGLSTDWQPVVSTLVRQTVNTPLPAGFSLAEVPPARRLAELEFLLPAEGLSLPRLLAVLCAPEHGLPLAFVQAARHLSFEVVKGYLTGFIDLLIEQHGRFHVLDYKTNWLGNRKEDYAPERLIEAVAQHHYYLQYLIYCVAVHRYLARRLPAYTPACLGPVYYLFLRGLDEAGETGIHEFRVTPALLLALDQLFPAGEDA